MAGIGSKVWAIPGGRIPVRGTGPEPEYGSQDQLCLMNPGRREAKVRITILYADRDPVGPYRLRVPGRRIRTIRVNDLIDPLPVPLGTDYASLVQADVPILVSLLRRDTSQAENALVSLPAYPL